MGVLTGTAGRDLGYRLDEIDGEIDKIQRLIEGGSRLDPELAAGLATTEPIASIEKKLDKFAAGIENLCRDLKAATSLLADLP